MKKIFMLSILILSVITSPALSEEFAKEGTGSAKNYTTGTYQILAMEKERVQMNYEGSGISAPDSGQKSIFHNASMHFLGSMHIVKGVIEDSGFIIYTLTNGDKMFLTYKTSGKMGKPTIVKGTAIIVGGTGKISGIQGGGEFTRYSLQPPAKGKFASVSIVKRHYKIVEPKK